MTSCVRLERIPQVENPCIKLLSFYHRPYSCSSPNTSKIISIVSLLPILQSNMFNWLIHLINWSEFCSGGKLWDYVSPYLRSKIRSRRSSIPQPTNHADASPKTHMSTSDSCPSALNLNVDGESLFLCLSYYNVFTS